MAPSIVRTLLLAVVIAQAAVLPSDGQPVSDLQKRTLDTLNLMTYESAQGHGCPLPSRADYDSHNYVVIPAPIKGQNCGHQVAITFREQTYSGPLTVHGPFLAKVIGSGPGLQLYGNEFLVHKTIGKDLAWVDYKVL